VAQNFERFGKYILLEKLQTGGMAEIYLARRPGAKGVSKFLAIKRILPQFSEQQEFIDMFQDEAKIAINLNHANIVSIHEFGIEQNQLFLAMDYVEGKNLRQILQKLKKSGVAFTTEQIIYIIKEVAHGLDHAHRCIDSNTGKPLNIIHRDMSPQNIMISYEGEVKIVDFGIAKAETQLDNTRAGTLKGKFGYMSPEQADGGQLDSRTDVFALGIILWELLANDRLFVANNEINTLRKVKECQVPSLRKVNPNISQELERIVSKALAKDRNLRYQTAAAFHRELNRFLNKTYPDFSPHDFAVYMKTLFQPEIIEARKKMVEYSKAEATISVPSPAAAPVPQAVAKGPPKPDGKPERAEPLVPADQITATEQTTGQPAGSNGAKKLAPKAEGAGDLLPPGPVAKPKAKPPKAPTEKKAGNKADSEKKSAEKASEFTAEKPNEAVAKPAVDRPKKSAGFTSPEVAEIPRGKNIDTDSLSVDRRTLREFETKESSTFYGTNYGTRAGTNSSYHTNIATPKRSSPLAAILMVGVVAVVFLAMNKNYLPPEAAKFLDHIGIRVSEILHESSKEPEKLPELIPPTVSDTYRVEIVTSPSSGAEIFLDGKQVRDTTPAHIDVPKNSRHHILVRKSGFISVEQDLLVDRNLNLDVHLAQEKQGFLTVHVRGTGEIYVDNKLARTATPLIDYPVRANQEIIVRAIDPSTGYLDELPVRVGENAHVTIRLFPHAQRK
jgi:serine/threonine protein kinase